MTIYLNNNYGFIRHGDSRGNTVCLVREVTVWLMFLDAIVTYDRSSIGTREAFMQDAGSGKLCIIFGPAGRIRGSDRRGAGTTRTLRQAAMYKLRRPNPQANSAGSTRRSAKNNPRVMVARIASDPYLAGHDPT